MVHLVRSATVAWQVAGVDETSQVCVPPSRNALRQLLSLLPLSALAAVQSARSWAVVAAGLFCRSR